jgi:hypothetical protein
LPKCPYQQPNPRDTSPPGSEPIVVPISIEDFTLTDDEFWNFLKGVKASGELDLVTWEGYYEATDYPASVGARAFLIIAGTEKVYFGTPEETG